jgi:hypothetical protein
MKRYHRLAAIAAAAMSVLLLATPAAAQATRTWVSGVGDDANPCSRTAPCKTFAGAITKTATNGEIDCLDPGGFGAITITKPITIDCSASGHLGGVLVSGTNGIVVNVPAGNYVQLINLYIDGISTGINGVLVLNGNVLIANSYIYDFQSGGSCNFVTNPGGGTGVCVNGAAGAKVTIKNTVIRNNSVGILNNPSAGANQIVVDHSLLDGNITANSQNTAAGAKTFFNADLLINCPIATSNTAGSYFTYGNNVMTGTVATMTSNALQ